MIRSSTKHPNSPLEEKEVPPVARIRLLIAIVSTDVQIHFKKQSKFGIQRWSQSWSPSWSRSWNRTCGRSWIAGYIYTHLYLDSWIARYINVHVLASWMADLGSQIASHIYIEAGDES